MVSAAFPLSVNAFTKGVSERKPGAVLRETPEGVNRFAAKRPARVPRAGKTLPFATLCR